MSGHRCRRFWRLGMQCPYGGIAEHVRDRVRRPRGRKPLPPRPPIGVPPVAPPPPPFLPLPPVPPRFRGRQIPEVVRPADAIFHDVEALFGHPREREVREAIEEMFVRPTKPRKKEGDPLEFEDPDDKDPPERGLRTQEAPSQVLLRLANLIGAGVAVASQKVAQGVPPFANIPREVVDGLKSGRAVAPVDSFSEQHDFGASLVGEVPQRLRSAVAEESVTQELGRSFSDRLVPAIIGGAGAVGGGLLFNAASRMNRLIGRQPAQQETVRPFDESQEL